MGNLRFWQDMPLRNNLSRNDKLMVGNKDSNDANYIEIEDVLKPLSTDDLSESPSKKYLTVEQEEKLSNVPGNTNLAIANVFPVYGVEWDVNVAAPELTRTGRSDLHASLPVQSKMRGCLLADDGDVNYYLDANTWDYREDGKTAILDGSHGMAVVEIPEHWRRFVTIGDIREPILSLIPFEGAHRVPKRYIGAYKAAIHRPTNTLASVVNNTAEYRGGRNQSDWDGDSRSQLGKPVTGESRVNFDIYAKNRGEGWRMMSYEDRKTIFWLMTVEFAHKNSQLYLGAGPTDISSSDWSTFSGYYPLFNCGLTNSLGNGTGEVPVTLNDFPTTGLTKGTQVTRYRGIENFFGDIWEWIDGINIDNGEVKAISYSANGKKTNHVDYMGYSPIGELPQSNGYVKELMFGENGDILPKNVSGASSTTYWCDYFYQNFASKELKGLLVGGPASAGANAGSLCAHANYAPSYTLAPFGSRLCFQHE